MQDIIDQIHESTWQGVIASTGCAPGLANELLAPGGGSATLLEAVVPYATASLEDFIKKSPAAKNWKFCSAEVAAEMASAAYTRATELASGGVLDNPFFGLGITATLRKRGAEREGRVHQVFLSFQTREMVYSHHVVMDNALSRQDEENLTTQVALGVLARHLLGQHYVPRIPSQDLLQTTGIDASEYIVKETTERAQFPAQLQGLLGGFPGGNDRVVEVWDGGFHELSLEERSNRIVISGSFNPFHDGHLQMVEAAHKHFVDAKKPGIVAELSISNVDKGRLSGYEVLQRCQQFAEYHIGLMGEGQVENYQANIYLTDAPTFVEKSFLFPKSVFVVGIDTWYRLIDPKYYRHDAVFMAESLEQIKANECSFLVLGRFVNGSYHTLPSDKKTRGLAIGLSEENFRIDISSSQLRAAEHS